MPLGDMNQYLPGAKVGPYSSHPFTLYNTFTVGRNDVGHDVKFFGATSGKYFLWDESADGVVLVGGLALTGNTALTGTLSVGVNDTGYDVKFFSATAGKYFLWDESADKLIILGAFDITGNSQFTGTVTVGVNDTGHDVTFFGATTGCKFLYDESEDQLVLTGPADVPALKIIGAGSYCNFTTYSALGAAWADSGTPAFTADQGYMLIDLNGTLYRIPLFANA